VLKVLRFIGGGGGAGFLPRTGGGGGIFLRPPGESADQLVVRDAGEKDDGLSVSLPYRSSRSVVLIWSR
jgi:hypothetical protein